MRKINTLKGRGHHNCSAYDNDLLNLDIPRRERKTYISKVSVRMVSALWWSLVLMETT